MVSKKKPDSQISCEFEFIDPVRARKYLDTMGRNRNLNNARVAVLSRSMRQGAWLLTHQGISFNQSGELTDGQHRLAAVIASGCTVAMMVCRGVPNEAMSVMDIGSRRTVAQCLQVAGHDVNNAMIATLRSSLINLELARDMATGLPETYIQKLVLDFQDGLKFATQRFGGKKSIYYAPFRAAVFRAYYAPENHKRLEEFLICLDKGVVHSKLPSADAYFNSAADALRERYHRDRCELKGALGGYGIRIDSYSRALNALSYFLRRKPLEVVRGVKKQPFPVSRLDYIVNGGDITKLDESAA